MTAETPVFFGAVGAQLFGIISHPEQPNGVGVLVIQGGDTVNVSLQRNRMAVRISRELAARGYTCLRFDYHGLGESTGTVGELRLSHPFTEDAVAAAEVLRRYQAGPVVLAGACFSSRTALSAAPLIPDVAGVLMATPPVGSYERTEAVAERMARDRSIGEYATLALRAQTAKGLTDPARRAVYVRLARSKLKQVVRKVAGGVMPGAKDPLWWVSRQLLEPLETMAENRVPVLIAYGVEDPLLREFDRARQGTLGTILNRAGDTVQVARDLPGVIHGFPGVHGQQAFLALAFDWIDEATAPHRRPPLPP
jgi:alpha/beta superfamily hydrolase